MDSDMMRHWGRRPVDNRPYGDDPEEEEETQQQQSLLARGLMTTIAEESSQDMQYLQTSHDGLVHVEEEEEGDNDEDKEALRHQSSLDHHDNNINDKAPKEDNKDDADPPVGDHEQEVDNSSVPLHHSAFGQSAEDVMLNNSMSSPTGGKYRTVSVFGGVFAMPEDPVDSDNLSLSSASDGFSSEEDDDKPKRSPQRKAKLRRGEGLPNQTTTSPPPSKVATPRVVSPPLSPNTMATEAPEKDTATSSPSSPLSTPPTSVGQAESNADTMATVQATTTTKDDSMARALEALDQRGSLLSKVLGELESSSSSSSFPLHPQVMEQAMTSLQVSKQTLESAICLEDSVLSC